MYELLASILASELGMEAQGRECLLGGQDSERVEATGT